METSIQVRAAGSKSTDQLQFTLHEAQAVSVGRSAQSDVSIPWDLSISREQANFCWREGKLHATCLPTAKGRIHYRGQLSSELCVPAGESFRIGQTVFQVGTVAPKFADDANEEYTFTQQELRRVAFGNTERQMEILSELPKLISSSHTDQELVKLVSELLLVAIPRAEAVAVAHYDPNELPEPGDSLDHFPKPKALSVATRDRFTGHFVPSRRLLLSALHQQSGSVHIWRGTGSPEFTKCEGLKWAFCCPIQGESCPGWCLYVSGIGMVFSEKELLGDLRFTEMVAQFIGSVRQVRLQQEHLNRIENDLRIGRHLQENFLPSSLPKATGWEVAACFHPARAVSGDFYDVFWLSDCHLGLVLGDVCNKGVGSALFMAMFRTLLRSFSQQTLARQLAHHLLGVTGAGEPANTETTRKLTDMLTEFNVLSTILFANNYLAETHAESAMFVTTFFAVLDVRSGTLYYVNGGHDAPVVIGPQGIKHRLELTGPVVGMAPNMSYSTQKVVLEPGDLLFCYTDGVTEAHVDPNGAMFGEPRMLSLICESVSSAAALVNRVDVALETHYDGADPFDDITMLCVRRALSPDEVSSGDETLPPEEAVETEPQVKGCTQ